MARKDPQRSRQTCWARFRIRGHSERALSGMTWSPVTSGCRPPPHAQHHASAPDDQHGDNAFPSPAVVDIPCCAVRVECAHDGRVDGELGSPKERQPVSNDLQPARVRSVGLCEVKVANHDIGRHSATCFAPDAGSHRLQSVPPSSQDPARAHAARWWPLASSGRPHRQKRTVKGRGRWKRSQQDETEKLRFDLHDGTPGTSGQHKASSRSALRSHKSLT